MRSIHRVNEILINRVKDSELFFCYKMDKCVEPDVCKACKLCPKGKAL